MIPAGFEPAPPERPGPYPGALDQLGQSTQLLACFDFEETVIGSSRYLSTAYSIFFIEW